MKQRERKKRMLDTPEAKKIFKLAPTLLPGYTLFELTVGEATLDLSGQEVVELFQMLLTRVRA
jgi:hypothetical protein